MFSNRTASFEKGILAIDLGKSKTPGVARVDLNALPMTQFQIRPSDEGTVLGYLNITGTFTPLAAFTDHRQANKVMAAIHARLTQSSLPVRIIKTVVVLAIILLVAAFAQGLLINSASAPGVASSTPKAGVPMDADKHFDDE